MRGKQTILVVGLWLATVLAGCASGGNGDGNGNRNRSGGEEPVESPTLVWDEAALERRISAVLAERGEPGETVGVTLLDGIALLTGQVLSEQSRRLASETVARGGGERLRRLINEIEVVDRLDTTQSLSDRTLRRTLDSLLSAGSGETPTHIRAAVDRGTVYLLGILDRQAALDLVNMVGRLRGVRDVLTVFEFTDDAGYTMPATPPPARL